MRLCAALPHAWLKFPAMACTGRPPLRILNPRYFSTCQSLWHTAKHSTEQTPFGSGDRPAWPPTHNRCLAYNADSPPTAIGTHASPTQGACGLQHKIVTRSAQQVRQGLCAGQVAPAAAFIGGQTASKTTQASCACDCNVMVMCTQVAVHPRTCRCDRCLRARIIWGAWGQSAAAACAHMRLQWLASSLSWPADWPIRASTHNA